MSRVASEPVQLPNDVEVALKEAEIAVKGTKGSLRLALTGEVEITQESNGLKFAATKNERRSRAMAGTVRSLVSNMVIGVSRGFERRLQLTGVGYRAQAKGKSLSMTLGFSHPIEYAMPEGIQIQTPSQTEVVVSGIDKQLVGQVSAEIRGFRPPEPYKGKGVRYLGERVRRKEAKKT